MSSDRSAAFALAQEKWPGVSVRFEDFGAHLDELGHTADLPAHADEVYLCCACLRGDAAAFRTLEDQYLSQLRPAIGRLDARDDFIAEVLQRLRDKLLLGAPARIATYTGRGPLGAWLRVAATRLALLEIRTRGRRRESPLEQVERAASSEVKGPDQVFRHDYAQVFEQALRSALAHLSTRDRNVLRLHFVHGLNIEGIGRLYTVHRATVARWIASCRDRLFEQVRMQVKSQLGAMADSEFESLFRMVQSDLELSLHGLLKSNTDARGHDPEALA